MAYHRFKTFFSATQFLAWRRATGLTQKEVGHLLGVGPTTIRRWEQRTSDPNEARRKEIQLVMSTHKPLVLPMTFTENLPLSGGIDDDICRLKPLRAVDGDTVEVQCDVTKRNWIVRAVGFDAFESMWVYDLPTEYYKVEKTLVTKGRTAKLWLQKCVEQSSSITLERHPFVPDDIDQYGRKLRAVSINGADLRNLLPKEYQRDYNDPIALRKNFNTDNCPVCNCPPCDCK